MPTLQRFPFGSFVVATAFIDDRAVFALGDGTVRLAIGPAAEEVKVHAGAVLTAVRTADGHGLLTGGDDGLLARIDAGGKVERLAERPRKWIDQLAVGPQGAIAFSAGKQAVVRLADGSEKSFDHERAVTGLAFAPKGMRLAVARYNGVSLWWVNTDAPPTELEWKGAHLGVTLSPDSRYLVTSMQENALHGWRLPEGSHMRMTGYPSKPKSLSWSVKGRFLASSGAEAAILWPFHFKDGPQGKQPLQLGAREVFSTRVACHPTEEVVAIGYQDGAVALAQFGDEDAVILRMPGDGPVSALAWDDSGFRLALGTEEGAAGVLDLRS